VNHAHRFPPFKGKIMTFDYDQFVADIKAVCDQHGVEIAGTCDNEGIYGEITIEKAGTNTNNYQWVEHILNFSKGYSID
jgi:hypothetical protein